MQLLFALPGCASRFRRQNFPRFLVPRLCLGTHCLAGSACRVDKTRGRASHTVRSQAEPGNENQTRTNRLLREAHPPFRWTVVSNLVGVSSISCPVRRRPFKFFPRFARMVMGRCLHREMRLVSDFADFSADVVDLLFPPSTEAFGLNFSLEVRPHPRFDRPLQASARSAPLLTSAPWA